MKRSLVKTIAAIVVAILPLCAWTTASSAKSDQHGVIKALRETTTFGTLGIVAGQTARLSAVRSGDQADGAALCRVELNFFDLEGNHQGASRSADLEPGHAEFLDLERTDIHPETNDSRAQIYAVVDVISQQKKGRLGCGVAMSIELIDQIDGRTRIYQGAFTKASAQEGDCCCVCCALDSSTGICTKKICNCVSGTQPLVCPKTSECIR